MNGITLFCIAAILLVLFMTTSRPSVPTRPVFGKVVDVDKQEYTFYEF